MENIFLIIVGLSLLFIVVATFISIQLDKRRPKIPLRQKMLIKLKQNAPADQLGKALLKIKGKFKWHAIECVFWFAIALGVYIAEPTNYYLYLFSCVIGIIVNIYWASQRIVVYEYAIVLENIFYSKKYYLSAVDNIEIVNIPNRFGKNVYFGYKLLKDRTSLTVLSSAKYVDLEQLEAVFSDGNPIVRCIEKID